MDFFIDLKQLKKNILFVKTLTTAKICFVVKCNAYGHGAIEVAKYTENIVDCFAVANKTEALQLTAGGIKKDVLVLSDLYDGKEYPSNIIFTAFNETSFRRLLESKRKFSLKLDTGMNRFGFCAIDFSSIFSCVEKNRIHSVFSHIYDDSAIKTQIDLFDVCTRNCGVPRHIFASNFMRFKGKRHFDYIRLGLTAYGYGNENVRPIMSLYVPIRQIKEVKKGENVGYGINRLVGDCRVGTIGIGYGDGYRRKRKNENRSVFVNGKRCSVLGQICMDACMIDLSNVDDLSCQAEIIGPNINAEIIAEEWDTIPYDVLTSLSKVRTCIKYVK